MKTGYEAIASRLDTAEHALIEQLAEYGGIDHDEAVKVAELYTREKIVRLNAAIGTYTVKHGIFWERDIIRKALRMAKGEAI